MPHPTKPARGRGTSAGLDRDRIVATAMEIAPERLTMQAVADRLGVDRKALHHHVRNAEELRLLLARRVFESQLARRSRVLQDADWRTALREWGEAIRDSCEATGQLIEHLRYERFGEDPRLAHVDSLLTLLLDAGFDEVTAGRAVLLVADVANEFARQRLLGRHLAEHPQPAEVRRVLAERPQDSLESVRRLMSSGAVGYDDEQFRFHLDVVLRGLEPYPAGAEGSHRP